MFKNKFILYLTLVICIWFSHSFAETLPEGKIVIFQGLIDEALENNPEIQAAYYDWQKEIRKIKRVSSLPDPMVGYIYFGENMETRVGPQEAKYGLSQKIPFPSKLNLEARAQAKLSDMLKERYGATRRKVIKDVKFVYYDIFWVDKAIRITEEEKAILESLEKVAQRRYESNLTPQQDVIKAQIELSKLINKLFLLEQNRKSLVAKMNSILDRSKDTGLGKVSVEPEDFKYRLEELHEITKDSSQKLQIANLDIERAEYEKSLARLNYLPDFTLGFDYIQIGDGDTMMSDDGQDAWMGKVVINLPIWFGKNSAQLKEKKAALEASKKNYQNIENSTVYEMEDLFYKITTYRDIISLYKTALIPQTEQAFESAETGYETGEVDFLNWLDAERVLLQTRLAYYKTIVDYQKSIAYLEMVVGKDL